MNTDLPIIEKLVKLLPECVNFTLAKDDHKYEAKHIEDYISRYEDIIWCSRVGHKDDQERCIANNAIWELWIRIDGDVRHYAGSTVRNILRAIDSDKREGLI